MHADYKTTQFANININLNNWDDSTPKVIACLDHIFVFLK